MKEHIIKLKSLVPSKSLVHVMFSFIQQPETPNLTLKQHRALGCSLLTLKVITVQTTGFLAWFE